MAPDMGAAVGSLVLSAVPKGLKTQPGSTGDPERTGDHGKGGARKNCPFIKKKKKKKCKWLKHTKRCSISLIEKCELKQCWDTISHLSFATYLAKKKIQKIDNIFCIDTLGKQILSFLYNGKARWYNLYRGELAISWKFSLSFWPQNPTFNYLSQNNTWNMKSCIHTLPSINWHYLE